MKKWLVVLLVLLLGIAGVEWHQIRHVEEKWKIAEANVKAYSSQLGTTKEKNIALQLTVDQLEYFNDSVLEALDQTRKELKIKDKNLKALQQVTSVFVKTDTLILKDTLFREPTLAVDTLIGDEWYSVRLGLKYPSMIAIQPEFKSEKHIIVSHKKETVNPPKKFFLFRWFQKRHYVLNVDVVEKNPYVDGESSKYVEIIK